MKSFKKDKLDYIQKSISDCINLSKEKKYLLIYSSQDNKNEYYINTISYSQEDYEKELRTIDERYTVWKDWEKP